MHLIAMAGAQFVEAALCSRMEFLHGEAIPPQAKVPSIPEAFWTPMPDASIIYHSLYCGLVCYSIPKILNGEWSKSISTSNETVEAITAVFNGCLSHLPLGCLHSSREFGILPSPEVHVA
jgi:hypothetical protein